MIMPSLLLQKVSKNSKASDHSEQLRKRMDLWTSGNFDTLVREVRFIQSKLRSFTNINTIEQLARKFNDLMLAGKINPALRLLSDRKCSGILPINDETKQLLRDKHPPSDEKHDNLLLEGPELRFDDYAYRGITGSLIRKIAREVKGASGLSSLDFDGWKRILTSATFGAYSNGLCDAIATLTRKLCLKRFCNEESSLAALLASKLIPLDKNPGLRPIGIGEVLRRIIGRAVIRNCKGSNTLYQVVQKR